MNLDVSTPHALLAIDRIMPRSMQNPSNSAIAAKVVDDIHFLQERISRIKKQQFPNPSVLETYQTMLKSRESVLAWLKENEDVWCESTHHTHLSN